MAESHQKGKQSNLFNDQRRPDCRIAIIPEEVRNDLGLTQSDQFVVIGKGDAVNLKVITRPKLEEFEKLLSQAPEAKRAEIRRADWGGCSPENTRSPAPF
ncbi:MAG: hypothetical protein DMG38_04350 [Acidobacteria bacterium]|nr:MAG: hypothetical protein DMG38_04350 [Acidobacteriota bacterium]